MDYIQKDLDLIRMATGEKTERKKLKKKKGADFTYGSKGADDKVKKRSKTLSPGKFKKELEKIGQKEKKIRKSTGVGRPATLGKIKLPPTKKQRTQSEELAGTVTPSTEPDITAKMASPSVAGRSRKSLDPNAIPIEGIRFEEGSKIEAVDHKQWYKAKIVKVDHEKMDILIHFDGWGSRFDTWFPMTSNLIRGRTQLDVRPDAPKYESGEDVLAKWIDGNFYPATVLSVKDSGSCQVMYFDGMKKLLRPIMIKKMSEKEKEMAMRTAEKLMLTLPDVVDSPQSSVSAGSPSSDGVGFRRYRTSANDRERRIATRGGLATPTHTPDSGAGPRKTSKRRASQITATEAQTPQSPNKLLTETTPGVSRNSSDDGTFNAKKARLDKITSSLISKVSPTPESEEQKLLKMTDPPKREAGAYDEENPVDHDSRLVKEKNVSVQATVKKIFRAVPMDRPIGAIGPKSGARRGRPRNSIVPSIGARGPKTGARRGRPRKYILTPTAPIQETKDSKDSKDSSSLPRSEPKNTYPNKSEVASGKVQISESLEGSSGVSSQRHQFASPVKMSESPTERVTSPIKSMQAAPLISTPPEKLESSSTSEPSIAEPRAYKPGDTVLAKWADCRSYLAYIIRKESDDNYRIRYYDGMVKVVKSTFIHPWIGPLPDALKAFKPKMPGIRKQRSRSTDFKRVRGRPRLEGTKDIVQRRRTTSLSKTDTQPTVRRRRRTESNEAPVDTVQYTAGEKVLAKWTDLKWYPATIVSKIDDEHFEVRYHDEMSRIVRDTWLNPWKPPFTPKVRVDKLESLQDKKTDTDEQQITETEQKPAQHSSSTDGNQSGEISEDGNVRESKDALVLGELVPKNLKRFQPGSSVLARWTDGRSYPAVIRELLEGKCIVEYENGSQRTLKHTSLKLWNPSALPPLTKGVSHKRTHPVTQEVFSRMKTAGSVQLKVLDCMHAKEKKGRLTSVRQAQLPRQVVRNYDAYYARLPVQDVLKTDHHKFKCRVPGCTKSFRKEKMLRQHHKYYHQQRYKFRDQESQPAPIKRKSSKEDGIVRRRVSADYEAISKGLDAASVNINEIEMKHVPRSRGAKPPMDVYQQQHGNVSLSSTSSVLDSSSGVDERKTKSEITPIEPQPPQETQTAAVVATDADSGPIKKKGKRSRSESGETKNVTALVESEKSSPETPEEEKTEATNEDVIRCTCNLEEEDGFMIQCEGCFTWQHAICIGVDQPDENKPAGTPAKEKVDKVAKPEWQKDSAEKTMQRSTIDEGYVCWVCKNPQNVRKSKKLLYNNDFVTKGKLPSLSNLTELPKQVGKSPNRTTVDSLVLSSMMEEVTKMLENLHGIKQKIKIATTPSDHPLLKTFRDVNARSENQADSVRENGKDIRQQSPSLGTENDHPVEELESKTTVDNEIQGTEEMANKSGHSGSPKERVKHNGKKGPSPSALVSREDDEAYIRQCRENLLDHIAELESELDHRITRLNDCVAKFDTRPDEVEVVEDVEILQHDLTAVQKLLSNC